MAGTSLASGIGKRMRQTRKASGHTLESLALATKSHPDTIRKIENGRVLHPRMIEDYCRELGVNPAWMQFGEPNPRHIPGFGA